MIVKLEKIIICAMVMVCLQACTKEIKQPKTIQDDRMNSLEEDQVFNLNLTINGETMDVFLTDNPTTQELIGRLPLEIEMEDLHNNEKYYYLDSALPADPKKYEIMNKGDLVLYEESCLVIFYKDVSNQYEYTKIGHIDGFEDIQHSIPTGNMSVLLTITE